MVFLNNSRVGESHKILFFWRNGLQKNKITYLLLALSAKTANYRFLLVRVHYGMLWNKKKKSILYKTSEFPFCTRKFQLLPTTELYPIVLCPAVLLFLQV